MSDQSFEQMLTLYVNDFDIEILNSIEKETQVSFKPQQSKSNVDLGVASQTQTLAHMHEHTVPRTSTNTTTSHSK